MTTMIMKHDFESDPRFKGITPFPHKLWLSSPTMHGDELRFVTEAIESNWVSTVGENINVIEEIVASLIGVKHAVALSCGTAALHLAIRLAGEKLYGQARIGHGTLEGHKVFCSDMSFDATVNPVVYEGGEAVFIDTERDTWNMDPIALDRAFEMYPEVRLVVIAHLYGTPGKIDEIRRICAQHGALIVEDAAESLGATYLTTHSSDAHSNNHGSGGGWQQTGSFGDIGVVSYNGNKVITGSSGGMLLTDDKADADKVRKWSTQSREAAPWYQHEELGYNYRMSNIIAGIVRGQLPYLQEHIEHKKAIYERYKKGLADLPVDMNTFDDKHSEPNFWLSCILIRPEALAPSVRGEQDYLFQIESGKSSPQEILDAMQSFNAEGRPIWKPMHLQPMYRMNPFITANGNGRGQSNAYIAGNAIDVGADIFNRGLCLPSDNKMKPEEQDVVIDIIHRCFA